MSKIKPPAFIIIPYQLLADTRVKPVDEKLYGFIYWFTKLKNEKCTAGNDVLAALVKTTSGSIQNSLLKLEKLKYIVRTFKDSNRRVRDEIIPLVDFNQIQNTEEIVTKPEKEVAVAEEPKDKIGTDVNSAINEFEPVNPSYERLFSNVTQRKALERMIKKHGLTKVMNTIRFAVASNGKSFAPTITTPLQLESKLGDLVTYYKRENDKGPKMITI